MKYIPVIETLSELLSLPNSQVKLDDEEFRGGMELYVTNSDFVFNGEVRNSFYKVLHDFNFWHNFTLHKFKQNEYYIYSNDEYIRLK